MDKLCHMPARVLAIRNLPPVIKREIDEIATRAMPEIAFLRVFIGWETFLENTFIDCVTSRPKVDPGGKLISGSFTSEAKARKAILGSRDFISWANVTAAISVLTLWVEDGIHQRVINSSRSRLQAFFGIRNHIAHVSPYSKKKFEEATMELCGRRYATGGPSSFLLDIDRSKEFPQDWFTSITEELRALATQICSR